MEKRIDKSAKRAFEAYPIVMSQHSDNCKEYDSNESDRLTFIEGYHQAEKDKELTLDDIKMVIEIADKLVSDNVNELIDNGEEWYYKEVLKRFKNLKK